MAADLSGLQGARAAPVPANASTRPVDASRALVLVRPVTSDAADSARTDTPLGRSGVSVLDLLATADVLVEREAVAPVALEMGLESARGALLRQQPGAALDALDAIWGRASAREEGWYLRAGALTVSGLSTEADRVATDGLERSPGSLALRLVLSLARTALGDVAGARQALAPALAAAPAEPVLLAQQATLLARQGGREGDRLLERLRSAFPDHPAVQWAQEEIRRVRIGQVRAQATAGVEPRAGDGEQPASVDGDDHADATDSPATARPRAPGGLDDASVAVDQVEAAVALPAEPLDVGEEAFARLGVTLSVAGSADSVAEARQLLRAFSTGGTLAASCLSDQAHGARALLAALVGGLRGDERATVPAVVRHLLMHVRSGRMVEMERLLRGEMRRLPAPQRRWAEAMLRDLLPMPRAGAGAGLADAPHAARADTPRASRSEPPSATPRDSAAMGSSVRTGEIFGDGDAVVRERRDDGPVVPVRLGLGLLIDSAAVRQAERARGEWSGDDPVTGAYRTPTDDGRIAAALGGGWPTPRRADAPLDLGTILPPVLALTVAIAAGLNGALAVAVVALMAAIWLGGRRRAAPDADVTEPWRTSAPRDVASGDAGAGID
jgi:hypothetical protein